jgi:hypothetical protein
LRIQGHAKAAEQYYNPLFFHIHPFINNPLHLITNRDFGSYHILY